MTDFNYLDHTFTPYRQLSKDERDNLGLNLSMPRIDGLMGWSYDDFYAAAKKADKENETVDLFFCDGYCVIPCGGALFNFSAPELPEHCVRTKRRSVDAAAFRNLLAIVDGTGTEGFYPTPEPVAKLMASAVDWKFVYSVLEPSAGKGDLIYYGIKGLEEVKQASHDWTYFERDKLDIDAIEINPDLRAILRDKGYRVVYDDFLDFNTFKRYDLIMMNPPFADGDRHLMKALDMQKRTGGQVVCLLNAATVQNPYTAYRKELMKVLDEYDAEIAYLEQSFEDAERPTDVSIALIKVHIPAPEAGRSEIYDKLHEAAAPEDEQDVDVADLAPADFFERIVREYQVELSAGMELIRLYRAMEPHILASVPTMLDESQRKYNSPILKLTCGESSSLDINSYVELTRSKYWAALLHNPKLTGKLTSALQEKYKKMLRELTHYEFDLYNIRRIAAEMNAELTIGVEDSIMALFEQLTVKHTYDKSVNNDNVHYYNGWCSNSAYKVNTKVVIPSYGIFTDWKWSRDTFRVYEAYNHLADIEKALNYLDGNMTAEVDLHRVLSIANDGGVTRNIKCKFFDVTFYKKGTTHIKFTCPELLEKFNIYASRKRGWLPPCYGRTRYADLNTEEKAVVDSFQGEEAYEKVVAASGYYLADPTQVAALPAAV